MAVSGTEATMHAVRLARGYTKKNGIVKLNGGFHGAHNTVLVAAGSGSVNGTPSSLGVPEDDVRNTYLVEYNDAGMFESLLDRNEDIAGIIMEPVMGNVGVVTPKKGYLAEMRKITKEHGALLIFDEVITGFRLARGGAQEYYGIRPDLSTFGKIVGGGMPAAVYGGRADVMRKVAPDGPVYQAGPLSGNPLATAAGLATLRILRRDPTIYARLEAKTRRLADTIRAAAGDRAEVTQIGSLMSVAFGNDADETFGRWYSHLLDNGIYVAPSRFEAMLVSDAHTDADIGRTCKVMEGFF